MSQISFKALSWPQFHQDVFKLAQRVAASGQEFDRIVCIDRGGAIVARFLSDFLGLKISSFVMVAYKTVGQLSEPRIKEELKANIRGERVLLVDEIIDSGSSFELALAYLEQFQPQQITTLAPYIKLVSRFKPDFWQVKTDKWVVFPYEVRETIQDVFNMLHQQGKSEVEIRKQISEFGFDDEQVNYFFDLK